MANILGKNSSTHDKINRLMAIEYEQQNADICDYIISGDDPAQAAKEITSNLLKKSRKK